MTGHFINVCSCGDVLSQCRCPSPTKTRKVIPNECEKCRSRFSKMLTHQTLEAISNAHRERANGEGL